jgi:hypothetical protein
MIHYEVAHVAFERHEWEVSRQVAVHYAGLFVGERAKAEHVSFGDVSSSSMMLALGGWGLLCPEAEELVVYEASSPKYAGYGLLGAASDIGRGTLSAGG